MTKRIEIVQITTVPQTLYFFESHIRYLQENGFNVSIMSSPEPMIEELGRATGVRAIGVSMERRPNPLRDLRSLWDLVRELRKLKPDIVHSHTPKAGLLGTLAARIAGCPVVVVSIFGLPQMTSNGVSAAVLNLMTRLSCTVADLVWSDSSSLRAYLVQSGLCDEAKVVVIGNGSVSGVDAIGRFSRANLPPGSRERIRQGMQIPADAAVIGFIGRICADKGMRELASAWRRLRESHPDLHLMLVGPMESEDPISRDDEMLFRQDCRVHVVGYRSDIPECFSAMDLFVMPSYREGFGLVNIEASAMELPVVSTRIPGCVDSVVDGVTGTLIPPRDAEALYRAIVRYLDDPQLALRQGRAGRERVVSDFRPSDIESGLRQEYVRLWERAQVRARRRSAKTDVRLQLNSLVTRRGEKRL